MRLFFTGPVKPRSGRMTIEYRMLPEFRRDLKKLCRRFPSLPDDLKLAQKAAMNLFHEQGIDNQSVFEIPKIAGPFKIFKLKKFACRSLKGKGHRSGIRVIYAYDHEKHCIHLIEIDFKGDKPQENKGRIRLWVKRAENT